MLQSLAETTVAAEAFTPGVAASAQTEATLSYLVTSGEKPVIDLTRPGQREDINGHFADTTVAIANGRLQAERFSLDREGFAFTAHETAVSEFGDEDQIRSVYYPEMERLIQRETGASRVLVFDHNVRHDSGVPGDAGDVRQPVRRIHNDYTATSAPRRLADLVGGETAAALAGKRFAIINVWRPIRGPVETAPLALADAQSVEPGDIVAADLVYRDRTGEIYYAAHNAKHRWVYFPEMERDEALLIKGYDSATDGRARFSLHTAFDDPATPENAAPRESIEVRALVFFE